MPARQTWNSQFVVLPVTRMIQSSSAVSTLRKHACPSRRSVSNLAPDFASDDRTATRSVAPATSSSSEAATSGAAISVDTGRLHLGEQRGRPAAAAEDSVPTDPVAVHGEQVDLVGRMRHPVLDPAQVELDRLASGDGPADDAVDGDDGVVPARELGGDRLGALALEPPVRHGGVEPGV